MKQIIYLLLFAILLGCNFTNHQHDGSYAMSVTMFGVSVNSKVSLIINGNKAKYNDVISECEQFPDRVKIGDGRVNFSSVDGDLILNVPGMGKVRFLKISGENDF